MGKSFVLCFAVCCLGALVFGAPSDTDRALIIYFSQSGVTEKVAQSLSETWPLPVDTARIVPDEGNGAMVTLKLSWRSVWRSTGTPTSTVPDVDLSKYSTVIIGGPVWFWTLPAPVRGWVHNNAEQLKKIPHLYYFCTMNGAGDSKFFAAMQDELLPMPEGVKGITVLAGKLAEFNPSAALLEAGWTTPKNIVTETEPGFFTQEL
ncbi:hypothetical protein Pelo_10455 [Pelomyxa schiedti]|nr:hypothetical protein Pelo_10455 [Pelomyxa schiedti]